jgi:uncharacterized repeat protein (TIGR01451 family)/fimbrial isopeptide formation D2 family protein
MGSTRHNGRRSSRFEVIAILLGLALIVSQAIGVVTAAAGTSRDRTGSFSSDTTKVSQKDTRTTTSRDRSGTSTTTTTKTRGTTTTASSISSLNVDLDQYANTDAAWQNGDLNGNNSAYNEGDVVPFRLAIEGLTAGSHTIHINYDFTAGSVEAYDFLATWNVTEHPGLCDAGGGGVSSMCGGGLGSADTMVFPTDSFQPGTAAGSKTKSGLTVAGAESFSGVSRNLTMYGGTITGITGPTHAGAVGNNSTGDFVVTFNKVGTDGAVLFAWGGHLAESAYWKNKQDGYNGASQISGAPWHMRTQQLDGSGNKNQDRSIQPSAIIPLPALEIAKSASSSNVSPGDTFTYTITVSNTGSATASPVVITDDLDNSLTNVSATYDIDPGSGSDGSCTVGAGNTISCPASGTISLAKNDGDTTSPESDVVEVTVSATAPSDACPTLLNTASAQLGTDTPISSNQVTVTVTGCAPDMSIAKKAVDANGDPISSVAPGDSFSYVIDVTNAGNADATGVIVTDDLDDTLTVDSAGYRIDGGTASVCAVGAGNTITCPSSGSETLAPGSTMSVTVDVTTDDSTCGTLMNTAHVDFDGSQPGLDSQLVEVDVAGCTADLTITKDAVDANGDPVSSVAPGDSFSYVIDVTNAGNADASGVIVTDTVDNTLTIDAASYRIDGGSATACGVGGSTVTCPSSGSETLAPGSTLEVTIAVTTDVETCKTLLNTAHVDFDGSETGLDSNEVGVDVSGCSVNVTVTKSASSTTVAAGDAVIFTVVATNNGSVTANDVQVTDTLANGLTITDATWSNGGSSGNCTLNGQAVTCDVGSLAGGQSATVTITVATTATACPSVANTAHVSASNEDEGANLNNDSAPVTVNVNCATPPPPAGLGIQIVKGGPALAHIGDTITYTLDVSLTTSTPLTNITVTDPICDAAPTLGSKTGGDQDAWLESGETWHFSCTHLVTKADPDPLPNTATVSGTDSQGRNTSDTDSHLVDLIHPGIKIVKTANPLSIGPGETVTYTYKVTNVGDVTLYNVTVDDDKLGHICDIAQLDVGDTQTCTKDFTAGATNVGPLKNVAIAEGEDETGFPVRDSDTAQVDVVLGTVVTPTSTPPGGTAFTGSSLLPMAAAAIVLLLIGTGLIYLGRRREDGSQA